MKKTEAIQLTDDTTSELAPIIRIGTETVLSQYPLHRLAKKSSFEIRVTKANARGKLVTTWEVSASQKYGEPGPLAYKLDTILINREIDESRPNIPEVIRLGSLRDICVELGMSPEGKNTQLIKKALHQNASAYITAKLDYRSKDGSERNFEFGASRYEVIFVGQKLPNGVVADAVYIVLHRTFREFLSHANTRPLDYEYLKSLPPAAQRLYELLSFQIYAALKYGNPRAKYLYSDFCRFAPLTRYEVWDKVKKQLHKIHRHHKQSNYISKVEFEQITGEDGRPDWVMWYTPGRKAKREFKEFTPKRLEAQSEKPQFIEALLLESKEASGQVNKLSIKQENKKSRKTVETIGVQIQTPEGDALIEKLTSHGIDGSRAARLVESDRAECEVWADAWPHQNQKGMDNPAAVLISFIEKKRRPLPAGYKKAQQAEERRKEQEDKQQRQRATELHFDYFAPLYRNRLREEFLQIKQTHPEEFKEFSTYFETKFAKMLRMVTSEETREKFTFQKASEFFNEMRPELGITLTTFEEWNDRDNQENADPLCWFNRDPKGILKEFERRQEK